MHLFFQGADSDSFPIQCGMDEAGRGSLLGNVFAAAVILDPNKSIHAKLNDSKKLSRKLRAELRTWIQENAISWSVASSSNIVIDQINILNATQDALYHALDGLHVKPDLALVDGDYFKGHDCIPHKCVISGDTLYANIAAASILAKEFHDQHIRDIIDTNPTLGALYDLENNMGYGTKKHISAIETFGVTRFHRLTFGRVREQPMRYEDQ